VAPLIGLLSIYGTQAYSEGNHLVTRLHKRDHMSMKGVIECEIQCIDVGVPILVVLSSLQPDTWWLHSIHITHPSGSEWIAPCYHWFDDDCFLYAGLAVYPYVSPTPFSYSRSRSHSLTRHFALQKPALDECHWLWKQLGIIGSWWQR